MKGKQLTLPLRVYRGLTAVAAVATPAWLGYRASKGKEDPARLSERRGVASRPRPDGPLIWVHGASVGEMNSVMPLIERLAERNFGILLTSGTLTSSRIAARRAPRGVIHQFIPLDAQTFVRRFLDHWQPDLALLAESELWPNLMGELGRRGTPLVLVNGRLSPRSAERWSKLPRSARALLSRVDLCLAQTHEDAQRFKALGTPRVEMAGNLKFDVPAPAASRAALEEMRAATLHRPILLAASTHAGEDEQVIAAHGLLREHVPGLLTVVVPRHPERGGDIFGLAADAGLEAAQRSAGLLPGPATQIYVADTLGELGLFYRLAPAVFMGGSLVRHGGQNPIEPAKLGTAVIHGPHIWNFGAIYHALDEGQAALLAADANDLAGHAYRLLTDGAFQERTAGAAYALVRGWGGALERTLAAIEPYLIQIRLAR